MPTDSSSEQGRPIEPAGIGCVFALWLAVVAALIVFLLIACLFQ